jgi:hypothetical protein
MHKKLQAGIIVTYSEDHPTTTYYVSFLDPAAKTASITSIKTPLVIHHNVPWTELTILRDAEGEGAV